MAKYDELISIINRLTKQGKMRPEDSLTLKKDIRDFKHAISTKKSRKALQVADKFSKKLLELLG